MIDNETQLFIRACKRSNSAKTCESILRRFFLVKKGTHQSQEHHDDYVINYTIAHLTKIVDKYCPMTSIELINGIIEKQSFFEDDRSVKEIARDMLISRIRYTNRDKFEGLRVQAFLKNKYNK